MSHMHMILGGFFQGGYLVLFAVCFIFIIYATVNSGREGRICERPKMIGLEPITGRGP